MSARYVPGAAAVLVGPRGLVATGRDQAAQLVALSGADLVVLAVIDTLSGGTLANLPDFACVIADGDDLRIVVRGNFTASSGGQTWTGEGVATWREHIVPGAAGAEVTVEAVGGDSGPELPVGSGIVLASRVTWSAGPALPAGAEPVTAAAAPAPPVLPPPTLPPPTLPPPTLPPPSGPPTSGPPEPVAQAAQPVTPPPSIDPEATYGESDFDAMFGATVLGRPQQETAGEPPGETAERHDRAQARAATDPLPGDHDGRTITAAQLQALRERAASTGAGAAPRAAIVLPSGERYDVAPRVLVGRRPQARQVGTSDVPALVTVDDPYVSGTHLEVALQGGRLVVTDLSTNGTLVVRPGSAPEQLVKSVPTDVTDGTRLALSDDLVVTVELKAGE